MLLLMGIFDVRRLLPVACYAGSLLSLSIYAVAKSREPCTILVGFVIFLLHHCWAFAYFTEKLWTAFVALSAKSGDGVL
jgi:hypothetical protein